MIGSTATDLDADLLSDNPMWIGVSLGVVQKDSGNEAKYEMATEIST